MANGMGTDWKTAAESPQEVPAVASNTTVELYSGGRGPEPCRAAMLTPAEGAATSFWRRRSDRNHAESSALGRLRSHPRYELGGDRATNVGPLRHEEGPSTDLVVVMVE